MHDKPVLMPHVQWPSPDRANVYKSQQQLRPLSGESSTRSWIQSRIYNSSFISFQELILAWATLAPTEWGRSWHEGSVILETAGVAITDGPLGYLLHLSSLGAPGRQHPEGLLRSLLQLGQREAPLPFLHSAPSICPHLVWIGHISSYSLASYCCYLLSFCSTH